MLDEDNVPTAFILSVPSLQDPSAHLISEVSENFDSLFFGILVTIAMDGSLDQGMERVDLVVVGAGMYYVTQPRQHCVLRYYMLPTRTKSDQIATASSSYHSLELYTKSSCRYRSLPKLYIALGFEISLPPVRQV